MVDVDDSSLPTGGLTAQVDWLGLRVGGHLALSLHSSYEPGELSQWHYAMMTAPQISSWYYLLLLSVYYVLQSQLVATGYANNRIDKEAVKIDIKCKHGYTK